MSSTDNPYRSLPKVDALAQAPELKDTGAPETIRIQVAREVISTAREAIKLGSPMASEDLVKAALHRVAERLTPSLRPVINATGIIVHTNLGRAPLAEAAVADALAYSTLEFDLSAGGRGSRRTHAASLLKELAGAESGLVVNNNAAAVVLMLAATAAGGEVVISRGELIEIGGSFRVPEIMEASGARLVEVGTTNKTYARDYAAAVTPDTKAILKVHPSNYRVTGFTHTPTSKALAEVAKDHQIPLLYDAGAATFGPVPQALEDVNVRRELEAGVDLLSFSGDKILGGPQAGLLVGGLEYVDRCARHPLARALRADKLTLGALQHTLRAYAHGEPYRIPVSAMVNATEEGLTLRAQQLAQAIDDSLVAADVSLSVDSVADMVGGGSHPGVTLRGAAVTIRSTSGRSMSALAKALRQLPLPVIAVVQDGALRLHLRTIRGNQQSTVASSVAAAIQDVLGPGASA